MHEQGGHAKQYTVTEWVHMVCSKLSPIIRTRIQSFIYYFQ